MLNLSILYAEENMIENVNSLPLLNNLKEVNLSKNKITRFECISTVD